MSSNNGPSRSSGVLDGLAPFGGDALADAEPFANGLRRHADDLRGLDLRSENFNGAPERDNSDNLHADERYKQTCRLSTSKLATPCNKKSCTVEPMSIGRRMAKVRERMGLSQSALARAINISPQAIQQLESGETQGTKHLVAIARELRVSADWLLTGKGASEHGDAAEDVAEPRARSMRGDIVSFDGVEFAKLPVYEIRFAAGAGAENHDENPVDHYVISLNMLRSLTNAPLGEISVFQVDGDSMEPTINNRDWIFVDRRRARLTNPGIYCLNFEGDALVKRASQHLESGAVTLISDNSKYPPQRIKSPDRLRVIGRVFLSIRRH